jgi:ABC-type branched-subunit amino acid transport system substrate-binding protein
MKHRKKYVRVLLSFSLALCLCVYGLSVSWAAKSSEANETSKKSEQNLASADDFFDGTKMGDMSDFDPSNPIIPKGDTIKIGLVMPYSGPASLIGDAFYLYFQWAAHDYNKRGGIMVDGKRKMVQIIKGDGQSKLDQTKKVCERLVLQEKVHVLAGSESTPGMKVIKDTAEKYKVIAHNVGAMAEDMMNDQNFSRYCFQTVYDTTQIGKTLAYYFGQIRKKEKKFYILCQDYSYGYGVANAFKIALKEYYPEAEIVGEDYHKLFLTDFLPYLTKIKSSGAEVIFTGDWIPDLSNMIKQARQYDINIPFAGKDLENPTLLRELGDISKSVGLISVNDYNASNPMFKTEGQKKYHKIWTDLKKNKWKTPPYNAPLFDYGEQITGRTLMTAYWLLSVIERAGSTDPEKIIQVWENDRFRTLSGKVLTMRACDHKVVQDMAAIELVETGQQKISYNIPPYYWYDDIAFTGPVSIVPAAKTLPFMCPKLDRCKGKSGLGR